MSEKKNQRSLEIGGFTVSNARHIKPLVDGYLSSSSPTDLERGKVASEFLSFLKRINTNSASQEDLARLDKLNEIEAEGFKGLSQDEIERAYTTAANLKYRDIINQFESQGLL